jgi:hypothetical protein
MLPRTRTVEPHLRLPIHLHGDVFRSLGTMTLPLPLYYRGSAGKLGLLDSHLRLVFCFWPYVEFSSLENHVVAIRNVAGR